MKPKAVKHLTKSNKVQLDYAQDSASLAAEYLRVYSPSAEVRQHGNPLLVYGKANVIILELAPVGRYGIKITFDDGHDSGIFSWTYLRELFERHDQLWDQYLQRLHEARKSRYPDQQIVMIHPANPS